MAYDTTGKRRRTENLAGQVTATAWNYCHKIDSASPFDDIDNWRSSLERRVQSAEHVANNLNQYTSIEQSEQSTNLSSVALAKEDRTILSMSYDRMGRRETKNDKRFVYNGYLQVADNNGNVYVWDSTEPVATRPLVWRHAGETLFYVHDGNKNVSEVVASDGTLAAHYEYAPFGAVPSQMGALASGNPFRFSSEYVEDDTTTVYYNYRHYEPSVGRWLQRDSMSELYETSDSKFEDSRTQYKYAYLFVNNNTLNAVDTYGLDIYLTEGNKNACWQIGNRFFHQEICVDIWAILDDDDCCKTKIGRACYSFAATRIGLDWPSFDWLGDASSQFGSPLRGKVYVTGDLGLKDIKVLKTNCKEDESFADILDGMVGEEATYSVLRHNCRAFSQMMYEDATMLFSGGTLPGASESCPCPVK